MFGLVDLASLMTHLLQHAISLLSFLVFLFFWFFYLVASRTLSINLIFNSSSFIQSIISLPDSKKQIVSCINGQMVLNFNRLNNLTKTPLGFTPPRQNFKDCVFLENMNSQLTLSKFRFFGNKCKLHAAHETSFSLHNFQLK